MPVQQPIKVLKLALERAGVPPTIIGRILRHSSWETTRKHYVQAEVQHDALILAERLNQFLKPAIRLPEKSLMNKQIELNNFKNELRNCWDNGAELWSCVLFSKRYSNEQLKQFESTLGPPDSSGKLLRTITVPIDELTTLSYWYFGDSEDDIAALTGCVDRIEQSLSAVPTPGFVCPKELTAADRKLLRWTSLFYWVAWTCNEAYLQAELDYLEKHTIFEWQVNRMQEITGYGDPWKWMLLQAGGSEHLRQIENDLAGDGRSWPDVMHGYVNLEFFKGSIAAIDLFCSRLSTPGETHPVPRTVTPRQKQKWKRQTRQQ